MAEENQAQQEPQQVTKEPQQVMKESQKVTTKDPKKVEAGKRLAAINLKKREAKKREEAQNGGVSQYHGIGAVIAVGVIGGLGYYINQAKKGEASGEVPNNPPTQPSPPVRQTNKFEMD